MHREPTLQLHFWESGQFQCQKMCPPQKIKKKNVYRETGIRFLGKQIIVIL